MELKLMVKGLKFEATEEGRDPRKYGIELENFAYEGKAEPEVMNESMKTLKKLLTQIDFD